MIKTIFTQQKKGLYIPISMLSRFSRISIKSTDATDLNHKRNLGAKFGKHHLVVSILKITY